VTAPEVLDAQRRMWALGDYAAVARRLLPISEMLVDAAGIGEGQRVLDVGVGSGNTAVLATKRGAEVVGVDLTPSQLDLARARCAEEGVEVELREGNAEALPFADDEFDAVVSCLGMIFAPDHTAAAGEMARVGRTGATVALTAWAGRSWSQRLWQAAADLIPPAPPGAPRPDEWGDPDVATARLEAAGLVVRTELRPFHWDYPSVTEALDFYRANAGPFVGLFDKAAEIGVTAEVTAAAESAMEEANEATDGSCRLPAPVLIAVAEVPIEP